MEAVLNTISRLPEDANMEEIMYRLYVLENIRRGQEDAVQGNRNFLARFVESIDGGAGDARVIKRVDLVDRCNFHSKFARY
jgi:hypothetical protein